MIRLLRLYQSQKGIWRYDIERDGKIYWSSLHTRDERKARKHYQQLKARLMEAQRDMGKRDAVRR